MKIMINNDTNKIIDNLSYISERANNRLGDNQPKTTFMLEISCNDIPTNFSIKDQLGWVMDLNVIEDIKIFNDAEEMIWDYTNYNRVNEMYTMNESGASNRLIIRFV